MDTVRVAVRVRPLNSRERTTENGISWNIQGSQITPLAARPGAPTAPYSFGPLKRARARAQKRRRCGKAPPCATYTGLPSSPLPPRAPAASSRPRHAADRVFGEGARTEDLYAELAKDVIASAMAGINGTIFAYGQTSSGKTHTMQGSTDEPGIIPLAIRDVFDFVETVRSRGSRRHARGPHQTAH